MKHILLIIGIVLAIQVSGQSSIIIEEDTATVYIPATSGSDWGYMVEHKNLEEFNRLHRVTIECDCITLQDLIDYKNWCKANPYPGQKIEALVIEDDNFKLDTLYLPGPKREPTFEGFIEWMEKEQSSY